MADLSSALFGTAPSSKIEAKTLKTPEQEQLLQQLIGQLGPYMQAGGLGNLESTSLAGLEKFAEEGAAGGSQLFQAGGEAIQRLLGQGEDDFEQFYQTGIQEPLLQEFEEDILPRISRRFGPSGLFGSERREADVGAREDLMQQLVRGRAETRLGARQQELQAAGMIPGFETGRAQVGLGTAQAGLEERRKRMAQALAALGIQPLENIATVTGGTEGLVSSFLGGAGGGELIKKFL